MLGIRSLSSGETGGDADGRTGDGVEQNPYCEVENRDCVSNVHCGNWRGLRMHQESVNSPGGVLHTSSIRLYGSGFGRYRDRDAAL